MRQLEKSGKQFEFPVRWGIDLQTEHERYLTEEYVGRPVVVIQAVWTPALASSMWAPRTPLSSTGLSLTCGPLPGSGVAANLNSLSSPERSLGVWQDQWRTQG